jgi:hypothetical protein
VGEKMSDVKVTNNAEKAAFLKKTLSANAMSELRVQKEFTQKKNDYKWVSDSLLKMFGKKQSRVSYVIELLEVKQDIGETLREFLSRIRVAGCKLLSSVTDEDEREELLVMAFRSGLKNKKIAMCLKEFKPETLNEAFDIIKHEKSLNDGSRIETTHCRRISADDQGEIYQLKTQIQELYQELRSLKTEIRSLKTRPFDKQERVPRKSPPEMGNRRPTYNQEAPRNSPPEMGNRRPTYNQDAPRNNPPEIVNRRPTQYQEAQRTGTVSCYSCGKT